MKVLVGGNIKGVFCILKTYVNQTIITDLRRNKNRIVQNQYNDAAEVAGRVFTANCYNISKGLEKFFGNCKHKICVSRQYM